MDFTTRLFTFHPHNLGRRKLFMRAHNRDAAIHDFGSTLGLITRNAGPAKDDGNGSTYQDIEIGTGVFFTVYETLDGETEHGR